MLITSTPTVAKLTITATPSWAKIWSMRVPVAFSPDFKFREDMPISTISAKSLYSSYSVEDSSYVYTKNASTGADDGWVSARADNVAVQVRCGTLNATSVGYRIEGRSDTYTKACDIYNASITSAQTIDTIINVVEKVKEIRVGVCIDYSSTPNDFHAGVILVDNKY